MVSGSSEQSDRIALVQRLLRYYAGSSNDTASDRDVISEHMGHLCVTFIELYQGLPRLIACVLQCRCMRHDFNNSFVPLLGTQSPP
jgi:hypothetical protein